VLPSEKCDEVRELKPSRCRRCGRKLTGCDMAPLRHQVWELPEVKPLAPEYQRHRLTCGETTCAPLPVDIPRAQSRPLALNDLLMAYLRQSKRRTALLLSALLHQPCSTGLTRASLPSAACS